MRVLLLMQWFDPEPTFKGLAFAKQLVQNGHEVEVLTAFPNYPEGKLYPGYRLRIWQREVVDGISVIRVPLYPSHDGSSVRRALNYVSFALSSALLGPWLVRPADVVYVYHAPGTIALPAMALKALRGMPFVYDINDLWPDSLPATGMLNNRVLLKCVDLWSRLTYRLASHVVIGSPGVKRVLQERGVPESKVTVIFNWCDEAQLLQTEHRISPTDEPDMAERFNVVFAGNMGKAQALDAVLAAAELIASRLEYVQFVFIGGGVDVARLKRLKDERGLTNVLFLPRRPMSEIGSALKLAGALLVHLRDDPLFRITLPSKTQAYLAVGRPILMAVRGDAAELVREAGGGVACLPEDAEGIAAAVEELARMSPEVREEMGERGAKFYWRELSLAVGTQRFEVVFDRAVNG
jgi:colanic acid biosynthesis glycosyl transferase WcaI